MLPCDDDYAVARVRMRAPKGKKALNIRVFFRLWTTGWTALSYSTNEATGSYPRNGDGANAAPLLGLYGGEINTIPCFAELREANMKVEPHPFLVVPPLFTRDPWPRGPRRISYQWPETRSSVAPPTSLSNCWILLHYACYTAINQMSTIFMLILIYMCCTFEFLPFPVGKGLRKPYEINDLSIETRS